MHIKSVIYVCGMIYLVAQDGSGQNILDQNTVFCGN